MELSNEDIRALADLERIMDSGEVPFVILNGERVVTTELIMSELGLEQGQTINHEIFKAMLRAQLAALQAQMALEVRDKAMTDTIPQPPCDYAVGRAQKDIRDAAASARAVDYVDHTNWEHIARSEGKPGGYGFLWWCIAVAVIAVVAVWAAQ